MAHTGEAKSAFDIVVGADISDTQLTSLLHEVYVTAGYTPAAVAETLFDAASVRARGAILGARERSTRDLLGMIIVVPPESAARQIARDDEAEIHLLAVRQKARGRGLGRALVDEALRVARQSGWLRLVLSTQRTMTSAQGLYAALGFARRPERDWTRGDRQFLAYAIDLGAS